jgi:pyruvate dehydrogenase E1 component
LRARAAPCRFPRPFPSIPPPIFHGKKRAYGRYRFPLRAGRDDAGRLEETREWLDSLEDVLRREGPEAARLILQTLHERAVQRGVAMPFTANTPYINTIPPERQPQYPGSRELERRIKSLIRWNAMAMVVRANRAEEGIGGHISTFASAATLLEVAFNHFFHARSEDHPGDLIYFQGHASPGVYARAFLEGRLTERQLVNFRRELAEGGGLSSYPHPWLMPDFWQFPTVSMGLGPLMAIYQARFSRYLLHRGLADTPGRASGVSAAMARWTSRNPWARLPSPRASGSIT